MGEPLLILLVHVGEEGHVSQEDVDLDDSLNRRTGGNENGLQVRDAGRRLLTNSALHKVATRVTGNLAGAVDGSGGFDGVRL